MAAISIIIPVFNGERYLEHCLSSIRQQSFTDFEALIIDDGSSDTSGMIADSFAKNDNRFKVYHRNNCGVSASRNFGIDNADGSFVSLIDADDSVSAEFLEKLVTPLLEKDLDFSYCDFLLEEPGRNIEHRSWTSSVGKEEAFHAFFNDGWSGASVNKLYRKSFLNNYGLRYSEDIRYCEDLLFSIQVLNYAKRYERVPGCLYHYNRLNENSATHVFTREHEKNAFLALERIKDLFISEGEWEKYRRDIEWRMLLNKIGIVFDKNRLKEFNTIHPEVNKHIWSNPFLHTKLRFLMSLLRLRLYGCSKLILCLRGNKNAFL